MTDHSRKHALLPSPVLFAVLAAVLLIAPINAQTFALNEAKTQVSVGKSAMVDVMGDMEGAAAVDDAWASDKNLYTPPAAPPVWGDVTRDRNVDLRDLVSLSQTWDTAQSVLGMSPEQAMIDLNARWSQRVPLPLHELAWQNRVELGSVQSFPSLKAAQKSDKSNSFRAIGFGITYPDGNRPPVSGREVYNVPADKVTSVRFRGIPSVGFPEDGGLPRYDFPVAQEETAMEYMSSYAQELDFTGADLGVEARYAMFSGEVRASTRSEFYKNRRNHKVIFKSTKSYGWFYLPDDLIRANLTEGFKLAKDSINSREVLEKYGEHYIYAEHRQGDLFIEVTFSTATEQERNSFALAARASFTGAATVNVAASIFKLKQLTRTDTSFTVNVRRRGGPETITFVDAEAGNSRTFSINQGLILAANDEAKLQTTIANIAAAWSDPNTGLNSSNAAATDFISRPMSDFYETPSLPWTKEHNLRVWFERYLAFDEQLRLFDDMFDLDFSPPFLRQKYRHYRQAGPENNNPVPGAGVFATWEEFLLSRRDLTEDRYKNVLASGRKLFESKEGDNVLSIFDPRAADFRLPIVELPVFRIFFDGEYIERTDHWCYVTYYDLHTPSANFSKSAGYEWRAVYYDLPRYNPENNPRILNQYISGDKTTVIYNYSTNCRGGSYTGWDQWIAAGRPGNAVAIVDTTVQPNQIVSYRCLHSTCSGVDLQLFLN